MTRSTDNARDTAPAPDADSSPAGAASSPVAHALGATAFAAALVAAMLLIAAGQWGDALAGDALAGDASADHTGASARSFPETVDGAVDGVPGNPGIGLVSVTVVENADG